MKKDMSMYGMGTAEKIIRRILNFRHSKMEVLCQAFISETGLKPSECELVEQNKGNEIVWFIRKREAK
jgi:hypothetical protein